MRLCGFEVGLEHPLFLIAGPCVVETEQLALDSAGALQEMAAKTGRFRSFINPLLTRLIAVPATVIAARAWNGD